MRQSSVNRIAGATMLLLSALFVAPLHAASRPTDAKIALWITTALGQDPRIQNSDISVSSHDGVVTLNGGVGSLATRRFADLEAKKIRGVVGVINELVVEPANRSDEVIRQVVMRRLEESPVVGSKDLYATTFNGSVVLTGTVESWAEREEAELLASEVAGVKGVTNEITVDWGSIRSDTEIRDDVRAELDRDVYLVGLPITVAVEHRIVTLRGTVDNLYERDRAADDARWVRGVAEVRDKLTVDWGEDRGVVAAQPMPTDAELKARVTADLKQDWRLDPTGITIDAHRGAVTLGGEVYSHAERKIAEADARDVVGVAWVSNQISTEVDSRDDRIIRDDVKYRLDTDFATADLGIDVTVDHGVVTLKGETVSWFERDRAADLAAAVGGVKEVDNRITIARSSWKLDADLTQAIKSHLTWNWTTWRVHDDIGVTVHNGIATLTGAVDSWAQRSEATKVALNTPGVWEVDNRLTVDGYDYPWIEYSSKYPSTYGLHDTE